VLLRFSQPKKTHNPPLAPVEIVQLSGVYIF
jgi:hypothetical protein